MERKSFASIETKVHPNTKDFVFDFKETSLDSKENEQIVVEIMGIFSEKIPRKLMELENGNGYKTVNKITL